MRLIVSVNCNDGEESNWISDVNEEELLTLSDLFLKIKENQGYFPTGKYLQKVIEEQGPTPESLYGNLDGYRIINKFLPTPINGFFAIREVTVINDYKTYSLT